jgi:CHAT domain-containing protein
VAVAPGLSLVDPRPLDRDGSKILLAGVSESVQEMPALAAVERELEAVREAFGGEGEVLLNDAFTSEALDREVNRLRPAIVHVASHSIFTGDPETSFLLTHGDRVSMNHLSTIVGRTRYRTDRPVELLTLSGCRTAAGDDRAALGLAGVAVRSGARSAVGSLWQVGDSPASQLMVAFYGALRDSGVSKSEALRRAQLEMIRSENYAHPFFWSPFLLIGNWL